MYARSQVKLKQFENDWRRALRLGIQNLIMRYDDDAEADDDGDGVPDEVCSLEGLTAHSVPSALPTA